MTAAAPKRSFLSRRHVLQLAGASAATIAAGGLPRLASHVRGQAGVSGELIVAAGQDNYRI
ncbi:MAG: twin-arginine translocation signal domain-containing protein, partial [Chloroflexota bacterium]|nr:twin-arginine translocation signal domain-containing protein [Chloroflexota bacterium]